MTTRENNFSGIQQPRSLARVAIYGFAVALAAGAFTPESQAAESLEFDDVTLFGGTLSYGGADGVDPLVGTDIIFDAVIGVGTSANAGVTLDISGGKLNFSTGSNISEAAAVYTFAGGGSFVLTGTVTDPGNGNALVASGVLLTGTFAGTSVVIGLGGGSGLFSGVGTDTKNQDLLDYFGIMANNFEFANTEIGFSVGGLEPDAGFVAQVIDADLSNTAVPTPTPVPESGTWGAAALLALSALGVVGARMRKCRNGGL